MLVCLCLCYLLAPVFVVYDVATTTFTTTVIVTKTSLAASVAAFSIQDAAAAHDELDTDRKMDGYPLCSPF